MPFESNGLGMPSNLKEIGLGDLVQIHYSNNELVALILGSNTLEGQGWTIMVVNDNYVPRRNRWKTGAIIRNYCLVIKYTKILSRFEDAA